MMPPYLTTKLGHSYRIIAIPAIRDNTFPAVGLYGICKWVTSKNGACLEIDGKNHIIPFDCVEEMILPGIEDALLITAILQNPKGTLKILRGLWRMTKENTIRDFMERAELPPFEPPPVPVNAVSLPENGKSSEDYYMQWEQAELAASGAFASDL
jgi:hypothetical protein